MAGDWGWGGDWARKLKKVGEGGGAGAPVGGEREKGRERRDSWAFLPHPQHPIKTSSLECKGGGVSNEKRAGKEEGD